MNAIKAQPAQDLLGAPFAGNVVISSQAVKAMNLPNGKADKPLASFAQALEGAIVAKENEPADKVDMAMMMLASFQAASMGQVAQVAQGVDAGMTDSSNQAAIEGEQPILPASQADSQMLSTNEAFQEPIEQAPKAVLTMPIDGLKGMPVVSKDVAQSAIIMQTEQVAQQEPILQNKAEVSVAKGASMEEANSTSRNSLVTASVATQSQQEVKGKMVEAKGNLPAQNAELEAQPLNAPVAEAPLREQKQMDKEPQSDKQFTTSQLKSTERAEKPLETVQQIETVLSEKMPERQPGKVEAAGSVSLLQALAGKTTSPVLDSKRDKVESPVQPLVAPIHGAVQAAATHASSEVGQTLVTIPDKHEVVKQIVEQARLINTRQNSEMVIQLKPDHLGDMAVKVSVEQSGVVNASFHSNNPEVRAVIEASLLQLKQELSSQGLKVDNVGVYAGLGQFLSDQGQRGSQQSHEFQKSTKRSQEVFEETVEAVQAVQANGSDDGVDYRI